MHEPRFTSITVRNDGATGIGDFSGKERGKRFIGGFSLFLIKEAWNRGCDLEDLADGFGSGAGTGDARDWSGIRDSSEIAINTMLERALNYLFPDPDGFSAIREEGLRTRLQLLKTSLKMNIEVLQNIASCPCPTPHLGRMRNPDCGECLSCLARNALTTSNLEKEKSA